MLVRFEEAYRTDLALEGFNVGASDLPPARYVRYDETEGRNAAMCSVWRQVRFARHTPELSPLFVVRPFHVMIVERDR